MNEMLFLSRATWLTEHRSNDQGYIDFSQDLIRNSLVFTNSQIKYMKKNLLKRELISVHGEYNEDGTKYIRVSFDKIIDELQLNDKELNSLTSNKVIAKTISKKCKTKTLFFPQFVRYGMSHCSALILQTLIYLHQTKPQNLGNFICSEWAFKHLRLRKDRIRNAFEELQDLGIISSQRTGRRAKTHHILDHDGLTILLLECTQNTNIISIEKITTYIDNSPDKNKLQGSKNRPLENNKDNPGKRKQHTKIRKERKIKKERKFTSVELLNFLQIMPQDSVLRKFELTSIEQIHSIYEKLGNYQLETRHSFKNWKAWLTNSSNHV